MIRAATASMAALLCIGGAARAEADKDPHVIAARAELEAAKHELTDFEKKTAGQYDPNASDALNWIDQASRALTEFVKAADSKPPLAGARPGPTQDKAPAPAHDPRDQHFPQIAKVRAHLDTALFHCNQIKSHYSPLGVFPAAKAAGWVQGALNSINYLVQSPPPAAAHPAHPAHGGSGSHKK